MIQRRRAVSNMADVWGELVGMNQKTVSVLECLVLGVKRTSFSGGWRSAFSQSQTFRVSALPVMRGVGCVYVAANFVAM